MDFCSRKENFSFLSIFEVFENDRQVRRRARISQFVGKTVGTSTRNSSSLVAIEADSTRSKTSLVFDASRCSAGARSNRSFVLFCFSFSSNEPKKFSLKNGRWTQLRFLGILVNSSGTKLWFNTEFISVKKRKLFLFSFFILFFHFKTRRRSQRRQKRIIYWQIWNPIRFTAFDFNTWPIKSKVFLAIQWIFSLTIQVDFKFKSSTKRCSFIYFSSSAIDREFTRRANLNDSSSNCLGNRWNDRFENFQRLSSLSQ